MKKYVIMKEVLLKRILNEINYVNSNFNCITIDNKRYFIKTNNYQECIIEDINNIVNILYIPDDSYLLEYEDLIEVSNNDKYNILNILKGYVMPSNLVIEGADGTGKSTIVKTLANHGILCEDRNVEYISKIMSSTEQLNNKVLSVETFLNLYPYKEVIFFCLNDINEMKKRINSRKRISEYDCIAIYTQQEYLKVYEILKDYSNIHLIDVTTKNKIEVCEEVLEHIKKTDLPKKLVRK